jgi:hypothetical protein
MEEKPFLKATTYSANKEITFILYDLKADYCVHNSLQFDSVLHQKNPNLTPTPSFFNILSHTRRIK